MVNPYLLVAARAGGRAAGAVVAAEAVRRVADDEPDDGSVVGRALGDSPVNTSGPIESLLLEAAGLDGATT